VKFALDWFTYDNGLKKGIEYTQAQQANDSVINQLLLQKRNLLVEIDSLKKSRDSVGK
jgi:hypothetical protein